MRTLIVVAFIGTLFVTLLAPAASAAGADALAVIVAADHPLTQITSAELRAIYLGEKKLWGEMPVIPIDLRETDPVRKVFTRRILQRTTANLNFYWVQQIFSGKGTPPRVFDTERAVKDYVASHRGAMGYVRETALDGAVKALLVDGARTIP